MDRKIGFVHHVDVTGANVHDVTVVPALLTGDEMEVYGDSGYLGADKREGAITRNTNGKTIRYKINRRPSQGKNGQIRSKGQIRRRAREKSSVRAKVEHLFGVVKNRFLFRKPRYIGRQEQVTQLDMLFALANFIWLTCIACWLDWGLYQREDEIGFQFRT